MSENFQVGQWIYCEFKLGQIERMEDGRVIGFDDGYGTLGSQSLNDRCFPLTMAIKRVSEEYELHYQRLHRECHGVNFPRIHDWIVRAWVDACHATARGESLEPHYKQIAKFVTDIMEAAKADCGYGFALTR